MPETDKKQTSRLSALAKGVASGWLVAFATALLTLILTPYALKYLSREEYAIFALANAFIAWLTIFDVGITGALTAKIAKFGTVESEERDRLASTAVAAQNIISYTIGGLGILTAFFFNGFFDVPEQSRTQTQLTIVVLAIAAAITASAKSYTAMLMANRRVHVRNMIQLASVVFRTILVALALTLGFGLISLAIGTLIAALATSVASYLLSRFYLPNIKIRRELASWATFREIRTVGIWFCLNSVAILILHTVDRIAAAKVVSLASVATLTLTGQIFLLAQKNIGGVTNAAWPILAEGFGKRDLKETYRIWLPLLSTSLAISFFAACTIWSANGTFIEWWVGSVNYAGLEVDTLFALHLFLVSAIYPYRAALTAAQIVRPQALWRILEAAIFVVTCIPLGYFFGLKGIMVSTVLATAACSATWIPILTAKSFQLPVHQFLWDNFLLILRLSICTVPVAIVGKYLAMQVSGLEGAILGATFTSVLTGCTLMLWGMDRSIRLRLWNFARSIPRRTLHARPL